MMKRIDYLINVRVYVEEDVDPAPLLEVMKRGVHNKEAEKKVENAVADGAWDFIRATVTEVE